MSTLSYFNDLTLTDSVERNQAFLEDFWKLVAQIASETKKEFKRIVINEKGRSRLFGNFDRGMDRRTSELLSSFIVREYEPPIDDDCDSLKDRFRRTEYEISVDKKDPMPCEALGCAYECNSLSVGFPTSLFWRGEAVYQIDRTYLNDEAEFEKNTCECLCITEIAQLRKECFRRWATELETEKIVFRDVIEVREKAQGLSRLTFCDHAWDAIRRSGAHYNPNVVWDAVKCLHDIIWPLQFRKKSLNLQEDFDPMDKPFGFAPTEGPKTKEDIECEKARTFVYEGKPIVMWMHLKYNGTPKLRIHFIFDSIKEKIVVGYVGPHLVTFESKCGRVSK